MRHSSGNRAKLQLDADTKIQTSLDGRYETAYSRLGFGEHQRAAHLWGPAAIDSRSSGAAGTLQAAFPLRGKCLYGVAMLLPGRIVLPCALVLLSACANGGAAYPALATRPAERLADAGGAPDRTAGKIAAPATSSPELTARLNALIARAQDAHRGLLVLQLALLVLARHDDAGRLVGDPHG